MSSRTFLELLAPAARSNIAHHNLAKMCVLATFEMLAHRAAFVVILCVVRVMHRCFRRLSHILVRPSLWFRDGDREGASVSSRGARGVKNSSS